MGPRSQVLLGLGTVALVIVLGVSLEHVTRSEHPDTVVVPGVRSGGVLFAFDRLRGSGLRVAIPSITHFYATNWPYVVDQAPRAGTRVKWGSVVTLRLRAGPTGSPSGPKKLPMYRVPNFAGRPLTEAVAWTKGKLVYWESELPPLPPSSARHLFDAYVITSQRPAAGSDVKLWTPVAGRGVRLTPLVLDAAPS